MPLAAEKKVPYLRALILRNPRKFSILLAVAMGFGVLAAGFASTCFEFGNGSFTAGVASAGNYLAIFWFGFIVLAGIAAGIAFVAGRLVGIAVTAAVAFVLLLASVVASYNCSKPISRFQRLIWKAAPGALPIYAHEMQKSLSDGTTDTFIIAAEPPTISELCSFARLSKVSESRLLLRIVFPDTAFPPDTDFYRGGQIELAYVPSERRAYVVWSPSIAL